MITTRILTTSSQLEGIVEPVNPPVTTPVETSLYRAINFMGDSLTVEGETWEAGWDGAPDITYSGTGVNMDWLVNADGSGLIDPPSDAGLAEMLTDVLNNSSGMTSFRLTNVPNGDYDLYFYLLEWEAGGKTYDISVNSQTLLVDFAIGEPGNWAEIGPISVNSQTGAIFVEISNNNAAIAGVRVNRIDSSGVVPATGVSLTPDVLNVEKGSTIQLSTSVTPLNATNKTVTYSSNNTNVATVSANGLVSAVNEGQAIITVTTQDGNFTDSTSVTVNPAGTGTAVTGVSVSPETRSLTLGNSFTATATITPANATNKNVTWSSSNSSVADVNSSGIVTSTGIGTAVITATTVDGGFTDSVNVTVSSSGSGGITYVYQSGLGETFNTTTPMDRSRWYVGEWGREPGRGIELENNTWGAGAVSNPYTRIFGNADGSFGWEWNIPNNGVGNVKTYQQCLTGLKGWHDYYVGEGWCPKGTDVKRFEVSFNIKTSNWTGLYNSAHEFWLYSQDPGPNPDQQQHTTFSKEIMIWNVAAFRNPTTIANVTIDGRQWDVTGSADGRYMALMPVVGQEFLGGTIDMLAILNWAHDNGWANKNHYVSGLELGNEVLWGTGLTEIDQWVVTLEV